MAENRAKKTGLAAEIEKKLESRYDDADAAGTTEAVRLWINAVVGTDHVPIANHKQPEMHKCLADGVMLCKLINKLLASEGKKGVSFQKKSSLSFVAMGNIQNYNDGTAQYGLPKECQFQSTDLWEGKKGPFLNVINGIHSLGSKANEKGFEPTYTGVQVEFINNE